MRGSSTKVAEELPQLDGSRAAQPADIADWFVRRFAGPRGQLPALNFVESALRNPEQRPRMLRALHELRSSPALGTESARVVRLLVRSGAVDQRIDLLLGPSLFEPEDWSFTFLEGLLRKPDDYFRDHSLIELGAGSGFISIALLRATSLRRVDSYDLNPIAAQTARINAYLNSYDEAGSLLPDRRGVPLVERFDCQPSNLLARAIQDGLRADLVVGCIPQVLASDTDADPAEALEALDTRSLYDLSNYSRLQGVYEDQFGLGLLARALEQAPTVLSPGGRVVLNVASRPGSGVIRSMFRRRGYVEDVLWSRRVRQAGDTDIGVLVDLEKRSRSSFCFYMGLHSQASVGARTAHELLLRRHPVFHDVQVVEGQLRFDRDLLPFHEALRALGYESLVAELDLSESADEQVRFLRVLADDLRHEKRAPYTDERGGTALRSLIRSYLERQFELTLSTRALFVAPTRQELLYGAVRSLLDEGERALVSESLASVYERALDKASVDRIVGNDDLQELRELSRVLEPRVVVLALAESERRNVATLRAFLEEARARDQIVIIDGSDDFEITSSQHSNSLLEFIATERPPHVLVIVGLIKNRVYPGLCPAFAIDLGTHLSNRALPAVAEATYSRMSTFAERYYQELFTDVLSFQLRRSRQSSPPEQLPPPGGAFSARLKETLKWPALEESAAPRADSTVLRLDYGENELELPERLAQGLLLGFASARAGAPEDAEVRGIMAAYLTDLHDLTWLPSEVALGGGAFPLLADAVLALAHELGRPPRIAVNDGHYGFLPPLLSFAGAEVVAVPSDATTGCLLTRAGLDRLGSPVDGLLLVNPNNPTGVYYDETTLAELVGYVRQHQTFVFSDEVFAALDLGREGTPPLLQAAPGYDAIEERVVSIGSLSKAFAGGGVRFGWLHSRNRDFVGRVRSLRLTALDSPAYRSAETLLKGFAGSVNERDLARANLEGYLSGVRQVLRARRASVVNVLDGLGCPVASGRPGGLFVFPDVRRLFGRSVRTPEGEDHSIDEETLPETFERFGLRVNPGVWAGRSGHVRICYSLTETRFQEALARLDAFARAIV